MNFVYINYIYIYIYTVNSQIAHEIDKKFKQFVKIQGKIKAPAVPLSGEHCGCGFMKRNYCGCLPM